MTELLVKAFQEASKLTEPEQNALARWVLKELEAESPGKWVLKELEAESKWDETFALSEEVLDKLADEALNEYHHGKTKPLSQKSL
jgi:hypothetical protein